MHFYFYGVTVVFVLWSAAAVYHLRHARRLPPLATLPLAPFPGVTVIIAARNEAARISQTIARLIQQHYVDLQIIVVNDRSTDDTRPILNSIAALDARVKIITVSELPVGWLGKCHACDLAARSAEKPWLLFTDADCWMKPDTIIRAVRQAEISSVAHITLTPGVEPDTIPARAWHIAFLITLANWISRTNTEKPGAHLGMGAFNLVRREAYEKCGGHEKLRLTVVDDIKLGKLLNLAGYKTRAFIGGDDVECHWGKTAREMIRIMEKNYFAAADFNTAVVWGVVLFTIVLCFGILAGFLSHTPAGILAALSPFALLAPGLVCARRLNWKPSAAFFVPLIFPCLFYAVYNSMRTTQRQKGIRWRETFYSLEELKKHGVR